MPREAQIKVSPAFTKAAGFQRAAPFGRARRREIPLAAPYKLPTSGNTARPSAFLPRSWQTAFS